MGDPQSYGVQVGAILENITGYEYHLQCTTPGMGIGMLRGLEMGVSCSNAASVSAAVLSPDTRRRGKSTRGLVFMCEERASAPARLEAARCARLARNRRAPADVRMRAAAWAGCAPARH